jgi:hypothetical protein
MATKQELQDKVEELKEKVSELEEQIEEMDGQKLTEGNRKMLQTIIDLSCTGINCGDCACHCEFLQRFLDQIKDGFECLGDYCRAKLDGEV